MDRQRRIERFLQAAHRLAVARLRSEPARVGELRALLQRWREQHDANRFDRYLQEWDRLLDLPIDEFERAICADDEHAVALRSVSPISVLISQAERSELLRQARDV
jgi:hypothetical protein